MKIVRREGVGRLYAGFGSYYWRCFPHAALTLLFAEGVSHAALVRSASGAGVRARARRARR